MSNLTVKFGSYAEEDVIFLLKDLSGIQIEKSTQEREQSIQKGVHYSEMLPVEYEPTKEYMNLFYSSLETSKRKIAEAAGIVAELLMKKRGKRTVLCSLARGGTPIGVLIKRYIKLVYNESLPHYSISIIRGRGIDEQALTFIREKHPEHSISFIDGWTGKGAITQELRQSIESYNEKHGTDLSAELAVLADPGHCSALFGTREDYLIPSALLNSTVSGLVSRTVLNAKWIGDGDFHGAKYYSELTDEDVSNVYVNTISAEFPAIIESAKQKAAGSSNEVTWNGLNSVKNIQRDFGVENINFVKPGVGETTRVLLRRVPWKILIQPGSEEEIKHILLLANDKGVPVEEYTDMTYKCCGLIRPLEDKA
ncbi:cysteine protease StiP family protein [Bacillus gobiensis]|uniref:cysteine protease StiP family protein n=1 Tax=Bacillus gobiensis TaxID=1441095 RepID=UPI003D1F2A83